MSRIGKKPIPLPQGVKVEMADGAIKVNGPKGLLARKIHPSVSLEMDDSFLVIKKNDDSSKTDALQGLTRAVLANMVTGVSSGFSQAMEIVGVGYRVEQQGGVLVFNLGYSHPINFEIPEGLSAKVEKQTKLVLEGIDKELLGLTCDRIRRLRPPEPYKGKGIRYANERIKKKAGKTGSK